ncbi:MAG: ribosome maturation factor RimM [Actinomycetota bacterium]|nr:ribosome maturation factor RimM [Actinomycetota bacterium]
MQGWLRAGLVGSPHGLDGSFHVMQATPGLLKLGGHVMLADRVRLITRRAGHDRRVILRVEGCQDRAAAQALGGSELLVQRAAAPALEPDEWWAEDLEGCTVHDAGRSIGTVSRLLALPSCEVLQVTRADGLPELLVPLVSDAVRAVDVGNRQIDVDLRFLGEDG